MCSAVKKATAGNTTHHWLFCVDAKYRNAIFIIRRYSTTSAFQALPNPILQMWLHLQQFSAIAKPVYCLPTAISTIIPYVFRQRLIRLKTSVCTDWTVCDSTVRLSAHVIEISRRQLNGRSANYIQFVCTIKRRTTPDTCRVKVYRRVA